MNFKALFLIGSLLAGALWAQHPEKMVSKWGGSRIETYKYTVADSAESEIVAAGTTRMVNIRVNGAYTVYIGTDAATLVNSGYPLFDNESIDMETFSGSIYARSSSGNADVRVMELVK